MNIGVKILGILNDLKETLGMDANYFYPPLITIIFSILPWIINIFTTIVNKHKNKFLQLYKSEENDLFYLKVIGIEFIICLISYFYSVFHSAVVAIFISVIRNTTTQYVLEAVLSTIYGLILTNALTKAKFIRKRLIGINPLKWLLYIPIILFDIGIFTCTCFPQNDFFIILLPILMGSFEIIGLFCFKGRYIEYKYSNITIYTCNGDVIKCDDISKIKRNKNTVIVENTHNIFHIKYDDISKTEYSGHAAVKLKKMRLEHFLIYLYNVFRNFFKFYAENKNSCK